MLDNKSHIELEPMHPNYQKFLILKTHLLSITQAPTSDESWWKEYTDKKFVTVISSADRNEEGKPVQMVVKNSYLSLKKQLA
jgi:hypothetical protein